MTEITQVKLDEMLAIPYRRRGQSIDMDFIESHSIPEPNSGCWLWLGRVDKDGYGRLLDLEGRHVGAHRASLALFDGPRPSDIHACHQCDNPCCVNPAHLFWGTPLANVSDCEAKGRRARLRGESHPLARLGIEDVEAIRVDHRSQTIIAASFGVTQQTVSKIKSGKAWSHV